MVSRTCGTVVRAVTAQSILRTSSSPGDVDPGLVGLRARTGQQTRGGHRAGSPRAGGRWSAPAGAAPPRAPACSAGWWPGSACPTHRGRPHSAARRRAAANCTGGPGRRRECRRPGRSAGRPGGGRWTRERGTTTERPVGLRRSPAAPPAAGRCSWALPPCCWRVPDRRGRRHHGDDPLDHLGRGDVVGDGVEAEHHAVRHDVLGHGLDVGRQHVVAAVDQGQRPGRGDQTEGGARAAADLDHRGQVGQVELRRRPGGQHQPDDVLRDQVVHEHVRRPAAAAAGSAAGRAPGCEVGGSTLIRRRISNSSLPARVRHVDLEQEPVALRLGQRVDALGLDRVLGRDDDERLRHRVGPCRRSRPASPPSAPASRPAPWPGARLISSASTKLTKTGPSSTSKLSWLAL